MKPIARILIAGLIVVAGTALAKEGVQDPTVKARMDLMGANLAAVKVLGGMAGDKAPFDAAAAEAARQALIKDAIDIGAAFQDPATDPVSAAKPEIWTNWDDFLAKADALKVAAEAMDASTLDGVKAGMGAVGEACTACHKAYQIPQ